MSLPATNSTTRIDVRDIAPRDRHTRIFAAFDALDLGEALEIVNDHDPRPLYHQFQARVPGDFDWGYLQNGPEVWRVRVGKLAGLHTTGGCCGACGGSRP